MKDRESEEGDDETMTLMGEDKSPTLERTTGDGNEGTKRVRSRRCSPPPSLSRSKVLEYVNEFEEWDISAANMAGGGPRVSTGNERDGGSCELAIIENGSYANTVLQKSDDGVAITSDDDTLTSSSEDDGMQQRRVKGGGADSSSDSSDDHRRPLKSLLKRGGGPKKKKGLRVQFDESRNTSVEANYVLYEVVNHEGEGGAVRAELQFPDLLPPLEFIDQQVAISPPEGYKDGMGRDIGVDGTDEEDSPCEDEMDSCQGDDNANPKTNNNHLDSDYQSASDMDSPDSQPLSDDDKPLRGGILKGGKYWKSVGKTSEKPQKTLEFVATKVEDDVCSPSKRVVRFVESGDEDLKFDPPSPVPGNKPPTAYELLFPTRTWPYCPPHVKDMEGTSKKEDDDDTSTSTSQHVGESDTENDSSMSSQDTVISVSEEDPKICQQKPQESFKQYVERKIKKEGDAERGDGQEEPAKLEDGQDPASDNASHENDPRLKKLESLEMTQAGAPRTNSDVRRSIERTALRRSLLKSADARKRNGDGSPKPTVQDSPIVQQLKWLTSNIEDEGQDDSKSKNDDKIRKASEENSDLNLSVSSDLSRINSPCTTPIMNNTMPFKYDEKIASYKKLTDVFNKEPEKFQTDIRVPEDVREWKIQPQFHSRTPLENGVIPSEKQESTSKEKPPPPEIIVTRDDKKEPSVMAKIKGALQSVVSRTNTGNETDIPSGDKVKVDFLVCPEHGPQRMESPVQNKADMTRRNFLSRLAGNTLRVAGEDRNSIASSDAGDTYSLEDIEDALNSAESGSSGGVSSGQSSPRLSSSQRSGDSGYQSTDIPNGDADSDELAAFVQQDRARLERLRQRYSGTAEDETDDAGFMRRPSVRGIKPRFCSTSDILKQMQSQLQPPPLASQGKGNSHLTWPYRQDLGGQISRSHATLPSVKEEAQPYNNHIEYRQIMADSSYRQVSMSANDLPNLVGDTMGRHGQLDINESQPDLHHGYGKQDGNPYHVYNTFPSSHSRRSPPPPRRSSPPSRNQHEPLQRRASDHYNQNQRPQSVQNGPIPARPVSQHGWPVQQPQYPPQYRPPPPPPKHPHQSTLQYVPRNPLGYADSQQFRQSLPAGHYTFSQHPSPMQSPLTQTPIHSQSQLTPIHSQPQLVQGQPAQTQHTQSQFSQNPLPQPLHSPAQYPQPRLTQPPHSQSQTQLNLLHQYPSPSAYPPDPQYWQCRRQPPVYTPTRPHFHPLSPNAPGRPVSYESQDASRFVNIKDERGAPEGASSSPQSSGEIRYPSTPPTQEAPDLVKAEPRPISSVSSFY